MSDPTGLAEKLQKYCERMMHNKWINDDNKDEDDDSCGEICLERMWSFLSPTLLKVSKHFRATFIYIARALASDGYFITQALQEFWLLQQTVWNTRTPTTVADKLCDIIQKCCKVALWYQ